MRARPCLIAACLIILSLTLRKARAAEIGLNSGLVLSHSCAVRGSVYRLPSKSDDGSEGVIRIHGDNLTIDFNGATIQGTSENVPPNERHGTGIQISDSRNVTLKHLTVRGYRVGLVARNCPGLRIESSDFSYNWKQRLKSTLEREDLSDWLSYHHNENDEWLRYGAGLYLRHCDDFRVSDVTCTGGQDGLMLTECNHGRAWNNDFSFLSGVGIGLYRSSDNQIMNNRVDWCVRGYSDGVYNRGQDSAGILVYEQSCGNTFAYNSVTHGGDGFFLWAGQTTMDTGEGGCNDNLVYGNDFSFAPTNGIEATFSRNRFVANRSDGCWHGVWAGYSYDTLVLGNLLNENEEGIALEHGLNNTIRDNQFADDAIAVHLWANASQDTTWGYPKHRDTHSGGYTIAGNEFLDDHAAIQVSDTADSTIRENRFQGTRTLVKVGTGNRNLTLEGNSLPRGAVLPAGMVNLPLPSSSATSGSGRRDSKGARVRTPATGFHWKVIQALAPTLIPGARDVLGGPSSYFPRKYILIDEWGPYDFRSPRLWPRGKNATGAELFETLGPPGNWKLESATGTVSVTPRKGRIGDTLQVRLAPGRATDLQITLVYHGDRVVSPYGVSIPAGQPYRFSFSKAYFPIDWSIRWYRYDPKTQEPRTQTAAFAELLKTPALASKRSDSLDLSGYGPPTRGLRAVYFATVADGTLETKPGEYALEVTSDDGARAWLDGRKVVDNWTYHGPTLDLARVKITPGLHRLHVEHFQIDGYWTLKVELKRVDATAASHS